MKVAVKVKFKGQTDWQAVAKTDSQQIRVLQIARFFCGVLVAHKKTD